MKNLSKPFMVWWLFIVIIAIAFGVAANFGGIEYLIEADITKLSFVIIGIFTLSSIGIGIQSYKKTHQYDLPWFMAETCMSIGMVGTLIGFILMLAGSLGDIDPGNVEAMKVVIADMAKGMSTALVTTLAGLISNILLKLQIVSQEYSLDK